MFKVKTRPKKLICGPGVILLFTLLVSLLVFKVNISSAQVPTCYGGTVKNAEGKSVPAGKVRAYLEGYSFGENPYKEDDLVNGQYYLCLEGTPDKPLPNKPVAFKVVVGQKEYPAVSTPAEIIFQEGDFNDQVNLTIDIPTSEIPSNGTTPGGGTPGGGTAPGETAAPAQPTASPAPGNYTGVVRVTLTCPTPGAKIYYTTDGGDPKNSPSRQEYTTPVTIAQTVTLKAVAVKDNLTSKVSIFNYEIGPVSGETFIFKDLAHHWAKETIVKMVYQEIVKGYEDNTFRPENEISRLEAAAILVRALKLSGGDETALTVFNDAGTVPDWGKQILATAVKEALIKGYPEEDGQLALKPANPITRAELATLLSRLIVKKQGTPVSPAPAFADQDQIPAWAQEGIALAAAKEIVKGYPDNTFKPVKKVTRAETAVMVDRLLEELK